MTDDPPLDLSTGEPRLRAARCPSCRGVSFPPRERCPGCGEQTEAVLLPRRGVLWTWTTQGFPPPSPPFVPDADLGEFAPFPVGYVEFSDFARVEGRLVDLDAAEVAIGMELEVRAFERPNGTTYAFGPVGGGAGDDPR